MNTTSEETRELRALDDALEAGAVNAVDPGERAIQELALLLRDECAPQPGEDFRLRMDARAATGFPRRGRIGRLRDELRLPRLSMPAFAGAAASIVLALVVAVALIGGDRERATGTAGSPAAARDVPAQSAGGGAEGGGGGAAPSLPAQSRESGAAADSMQRAKAPEPDFIVPPEPPGDQQRLAPRERRQVERSAQLTLAAPEDEIQDVAGRLIQVVGRNRGFVLSSTVTSGEEGASGGTFDLRIPAARLNEALRQLSALGDVRSLSQSGVDVTAAVTSLEEQLERVRADRRGLLRRLENASTEQEATAIKRRLRLVQSQINGLRGRLNAQRERVTYAQVLVTLAADTGEGSGTSGAWDDFVNTLEDSAAIGLRVMGVLIPLGIVTSVLWLGGSWWQRRRRESALG